MAKRSVPPIEGDRVRLRLLEQNDLPMTLAWRNQDQVRRWFFHSDVISYDQHRAWYHQYQDRDDDFVFIIEEIRQLHRPIGQVALYNVEWATGSGEFGRLMIGDPAARGQGLATEATILLVGEALNRWGLAKIHLEVYANNTDAIGVYERCGFRPVETEGSRRWFEIRA